jgi:hypothetical protein
MGQRRNWKLLLLEGAHRRAWKNPSPGIVAFASESRTARPHLTKEYTLEILERGRHLQIEDVDGLQRSSRRRAAPVSSIGKTQHANFIPREPIDAESRSDHCNPRPNLLDALGEMLVEAFAQWRIAS